MTDAESSNRAALLDELAEVERLSLQGERFENLDHTALQHAVASKQAASELLALDIGCGSGQVTKNRFDKWPNVVNVLGIDRNHHRIQEARDSIGNGKYRFETLDVESDSMEEILRQHIEACSRDSVDLIFATLVLQHLDDPRILLASMYRLLHHDGRLIVRGSDDGSKVCYPAEQMMQQILAETGSQPVRLSDRYNGRKLYSLVKDAGFKNLQLFYGVVDTVGMNHEQRQHLFQESFSFRYAHLRTAAENGNLSGSRYWTIKKTLDDFEQEFLKPDFYYMQVSYVVVADK